MAKQKVKTEKLAEKVEYINTVDCYGCGRSVDYVNAVVSNGGKCPHCAVPLTKDAVDNTHFEAMHPEQGNEDSNRKQLREQALKDVESINEQIAFKNGG